MKKFFYFPQKLNGLLFIAFTTFTFFNCNNDDNAGENIDIDAPILLAQEAYIYGIPLVTMDITRRQATNTTETIVGEMEAPLNQFSHLPIFPTANFTSVVRPNADTFYSNAWLDLSQGPVSLSLPVNNERYHLIPILDAYSNVIASPGTRTYGSNGGEFLITGPGFNQSVPPHMTQIKCPTNSAWIIGRTEVKSPEDGQEVVYPLMQQYKLTPPTNYQWPELETNVPQGDPNSIVANMDVVDYFNYMNQLFETNPPLEQDKEFMERLAKIGIGKGLTFKIENFRESEQQVIRQIPTEMIARINARQLELPIHNGWAVLENTGDYKTDYFHRAHVTRFGLGANLPQDAIYPTGFLDASGQQLHGDNRYIIRFEKDKLPPANAFWSLTMYNSSGFFVANELDRYTLGDRSDLDFNEDGSLELYFQKDKPSEDKIKNWLPSPSGEIFSLTLRVYYPKQSMIDGTWKTPALVKIN